MHFHLSVEHVSLISISGGRNVKGGCQLNQRGAMKSIGVFSFNVPNFFSKSQFVELELVKKCQRYQCGAINRKRAFLFFGPKYFSSIYQNLRFA